MTTTYERRLRRGRRTWDLASLTYYGAIEPLRTRVDDLALRHLDLRPGQRVLDVGCGTGASIARLRDAVGPDGEVVGVDYSPRMLRKAELRTNGWHNVTLRRADIARESLGDNEFDAAVALSSLSATPDVRAAVEAAHAALRPAGRLFVFDMRLILAGGLRHRMLTRVLRGIYRATAGFTGADVIAELRRTFASVEPVFPNGRFGPMITLAVAVK